MYGTKADKMDDNYQVNQAKIAIANGGWMGLGPATAGSEIFFRILILILFTRSSLKNMD